MYVVLSLVTAEHTITAINANYINEDARERYARFGDIYTLSASNDTRSLQSFYYGCRTKIQQTINVYSNFEQSFGWILYSATT